jgi:formylglycine-generating enzyme
MRMMATRHNLEGLSRSLHASKLYFGDGAPSPRLVDEAAVSDDGARAPRPQKTDLLVCVLALLTGVIALMGNVAAAPETAIAPMVVPGPEPGMVLIPAGSYAPILRGKDEPERVAVPGFWLDERPVTNGEFLEFARANPKWRRGAVLPLFADAGYLGDWAGDLELGPMAPTDAPVVRVSWFAARAYAAWRGKRLPTTSEWERAAAVGFVSEDGASEPAYKAAALGWFAQPARVPLPSVGQGRPNFHGVHDLLTLIWEWVDDFNTAMVTGESRADSGLERLLFCGAGAAGAQDLANYPGFMRAGMRSALRANYVVPNLGFRCAKSISP